MSKSHHREKGAPFKIEYFTYILMFPDGDTWIKQTPFVQDLQWELHQMVQSNKDKSAWRTRALALWKAGECWWKDELGIEHLILIEKHKRKDLKWGVNKEGMATFKTETIEGV